MMKSLFPLHVSKPTLKELWWDQRSGFGEMWQASKLPHEALIMLWQGALVTKAVAEQALREYNQRFNTKYTLDQVKVPTIEQQTP
jgi:hypothetical protein